MNIKTKGISLIVLVITIIVMIIVAGAIILSLSNGNVIVKAKEANFKYDTQTFNEELAMWITEESLSNGGTIDISTIDANKDSGTYNNKKIQEIIKSMNNKYANIFEIRNGKLIYVGSNADEKTWVTASGIEVVDTSIPEGFAIQPSTTEYTNSDVSVEILYPAQAVTRQYSIDDEANWLTYTAPVTVTDSNAANHKIVARFLDSGGIASPTITIDIQNIDKTLPNASSITNYVLGTTDVTADVSLSDNTSGASGINVTSSKYLLSSNSSAYSVADSSWNSGTAFAGAATTGTTPANLSISVPKASLADGDNYLHILSTDVVGNKTATVSASKITISSLIGNRPDLATGMTAIKWDGSAWIDVANPNTDNTWYNYENKQWANAKTADGSMWVWIPRYIYKISSGWHLETNSPVVNVQFSKGIDDNWNSSVIGNIGTLNLASESNNKWTNHPSFNFGGTELKGIWISKFSMSGARYSLDSKPGGTIYKVASTDTAYLYTRNMETSDGARYGWGTSGTGIDTHLIKNVEWGAVAYLATSSYGIGATQIPRNSTLYSGGGTGTSYVSNITQSTTGNIHGVYDMSCGSFTFVAAYVNDNSSGYVNWNPTLVAAPIKYKDVYETTEYGSATLSKKGDALYETSTLNTALNSQWLTGASIRPMDVKSMPFVVRGGNNYSGADNQGLFSQYGTYNSSYGFRAVILVDAGL